MSHHLAEGGSQELAQAILATIGYGANVRAAVLADLPPWVRGMMLGEGAPPLVGAILDIKKLDAIERLPDGSVPPGTYLRSVAFLAGNDVAADPVRRAIAKVEAQASDAPPVPASPPAELKERYVTRTAMVGRSFLQGALATAASVARLAVTRHEDGKAAEGADGGPVVFLGTGWLIAPHVMITNHHVINARRQGEW